MENKRIKRVQYGKRKSEKVVVFSERERERLKVQPLDDRMSDVLW